MTVAALTGAPATASPQQSAPLQGVWDSQVTLTDCNGFTLAVFRAYEMFHQGGTLTNTDNTPPTLHGPGFGTWERVDGRKCTAPFQFFNFNSDGTFAGVQKIARQIRLAPDGNSYTSTVTFETYDPNGVLVFSGCGTEVATRIPYGETAKPTARRGRGTEHLICGVFPASRLQRSSRRTPSPRSEAKPQAVPINADDSIEHAIAPLCLSITNCYRALMAGC